MNCSHLFQSKSVLCTFVSYANGRISDLNSILKHYNKQININQNEFICVGAFSAVVLATLFATTILYCSWSHQCLSRSCGFVGIVLQLKGVSVYCSTNHPTKILICFVCVPFNPHPSYKTLTYLPRGSRMLQNRFIKWRAQL